MNICESVNEAINSKMIKFLVDGFKEAFKNRNSDDFEIDEISGNIVFDHGEVDYDDTYVSSVTKLEGFKQVLEDWIDSGEELSSKDIDKVVKALNPFTLEREGIARSGNDYIERVYDIEVNFKYNSSKDTLEAIIK